MTLRDAFEESAADGAILPRLRGFMHEYMWGSDFDPALVADAPLEHENIDKYYYAYAACFVHYWCEVLTLDVPEWVSGGMFKLDEPRYESGLREVLERVTPAQFRAHNLYMRSGAVIVM